MNSLQLNPYLTFGGNCREAMQFYQQCLGGELHIQPFSETPAAAHVPAEAQNGVLHAHLSNGPVVLMASDTGGMHPLSSGNTVSLCVNCTSPEEIADLFAQLSAGGTVGMPLADTFWGATFGTFTDRFGINWMLNYTHPTTA